MTVIKDGFLDKSIFRIISEVADKENVQAFVIGGYVRDCFLGRSTNDIDVVVQGSGINLALAVARHIEELDGRFCKVSVFKNFGTAMLKYKGTEVEFVGARKESYSRDSRKPIVEDGTIEDDQKRRDFTINALALSLQKDDFGALVDPFHGIQDLANGIIKTPLEPDMTYSDDPLRMLRGIRFVAQLSSPERQFKIVAKSLESMSRNKERLKILSKERIVDEMNKILMTPKPSIGLHLLDKTGLMPYILPALDKLKGVETVEGKGHKDNFTHSLQVVDNVVVEEKKAIEAGTIKDYIPEESGDGFIEKIRTEPNLWLRWAALLHDVGKARTKRFDPKIGWTFHAHDIVGARMVPKIFKSLKMPLNEKMKYVQKLVGLHLRPIALVDDGVTDSAIRRLLFDAGNDIDDLMLLCNADITSKNPKKVARVKTNFEMVREKLVEVEEKDMVRNFNNPITGDYIMELFDISPCQTIGILKEAVKNAILDGVIENDFEQADKFMREKAAELGLQPQNKSI